MKMDGKQILEHIQQLAEERLQKKIGDAFLSPKIPTNTVSTGQAAATVQYPKATEIAQAGVRLAAVVEAKKQMVAARVESDQYEYHAIQHINGDIETVRTVKLTPQESAEIHGVQREVYADNILLRRAREQKEQRRREAEEQSRREAEEQRAREQYRADGRWGQF